MRGLLPLLAVLAFAIGVSFVDRNPSPLGAALPVTVLQTALEPPTPGRRKGQGHHEASAPKEHQEGQDAERTAKAGPVPTVRQDTSPHHDGVGPKAKGEGQWYARPDWWIVGLTGLLALMTGALWWVTWGMWDVTRKAVSDGEQAVATAMSHVAESAKAASAMGALAQTSSDTAERQLRAYVMVSEAAVIDLTLGAEPKVHIKIKNSGQTPAYDIQQWIMIAGGRYPLAQKPPERDQQIPLAAFPLAPNGYLEIRHGLGRQLTRDLYNGMANGSAAIYIVGQISYKDVFGIRRVTNYRMICGGPTGIGSVALTDIEGNDAT